ncbi:MAG: hypothetical protein BroJett007_15170 [Chloroflexota bacterium]|jgi:serine/threonine protein kinase|nr:hypothetical protein [Anaerolineae bacterium CFX4]OQY83371.1 MAG: hypothetical protein B6D42_07780 [Anaerolineae bacterium UTCFX5]GIK28379.1 MAG: hypothetical protein BroJett007_15170 [Chloroflexota bacterium]
MTTAPLTDLYRLEDTIDTYALGHYARVVAAGDRRANKTVAFKVMRSEHVTHDGDMKWEFKAFYNEAALLQRLAASPSLVRMHDCGYIESSTELPVNGQIASFGTDVDEFTDAAARFAAQGWRPYLALDILPRHNNLLYVMKPNQPGTRWRLPTEEGIALAMQFAQFLQVAHQNGVVYLDHKLEHVYWDGARLHVIDLNSSRALNGAAADAQQFKADIHNFCVGILYPVFTGISAITGGLRATPSSMAEVEARYKDILVLDFGVEPSLSPAVQQMIQRGAAMEYDTANDLIAELNKTASLHGWDTPHGENTPACRAARDQVRQGLKKLRQGQESIREARDILRDALIIDDITPDIEDELRRVLLAVNAMLNARVIP